MFQIFNQVWARKVWSLPEKHREAYYLWVVQWMPRLQRAMVTVLVVLLRLCLPCKSPALQEFSSPAHTHSQSILTTWSILYLPFMGITSHKACPALSGVTAQRAPHDQAASTLHATITTSDCFPSAMRAAPGYRSGNTRAQKKNLSTSLGYVAGKTSPSFYWAEGRKYIDLPFFFKFMYMKIWVISLYIKSNESSLRN